MAPSTTGTTRTATETILRRAATSTEPCSCADPIPVQRAERKGAALVVCLRCGLRVPARLRPGRAPARPAGTVEAR